MSHRRTVVYVVSTLKKSGPTTQLFYILKHLDADEFRPVVLTLSPEPEDSDIARFRSLPVELDSLNLSRIEGVYQGPVRLRRRVKEYSPNVIHTQGIRADSLSAIFLRTMPTVATARNYPYDDYPAKYGKKGYPMAWTHLRMYQQIDAVVACSNAIASAIGDHEIQSAVIPNGVDCELFSPPNDESIDNLREELDLSLEKDVVVSVGALIPRKEPRTAIRGFLESSYSDEAILLMLGDGFLSEECESLAADHDNVHLLGYVDDVASYLNASDLFLSASNSEGLPNSVMEAIASGLPVCLSDIGPHREIYDHDERIGKLFRTGDAAALSDCLDELATTNFEPRSRAARTLAVEEFSAEATSYQYQDLYREVSDE